MSGIRPSLRLFFALALFLPIGAHSALVFEKASQVLVPKPGDQELKVFFPYRNDGSRPVVIQELKSSCSCTTTAISNKTISPGEAGNIEATFRPGNRRGVHNNQIAVRTDDPESNTILRFTVRLPEPLEISPRILKWQQGEKPVAKVYEVTILDGRIQEIASVESSRAQVSVTLETVKAGQQYRLIAKPKNTAKKLRAAITVVGKGPKGFKRSYRVYAFIE